MQLRHQKITVLTAIIVVDFTASCKKKSSAPAGSESLPKNSELNLTSSGGYNALSWDPNLSSNCHAFSARGVDDWSLGPIFPQSTDCKPDATKPGRWIIVAAAEDKNLYMRRQGDLINFPAFFSYEQTRTSYPGWQPVYQNFFDYKFVRATDDPAAVYEFRSTLDSIKGIGVPADLRGSYKNGFLQESFVLDNYYAGLAIPSLGGNDIKINGFFKIIDASQANDPDSATACTKFIGATGTCAAYTKVTIGKAMNTFKIGTALRWKDPKGTDRIHFFEAILYDAPNNANTQSPDRYVIGDKSNKLQRYQMGITGSLSLVYFMFPNMASGATMAQLPNVLRTNCPAVTSGTKVRPDNTWQFVEFNVTALAKCVKWTFPDQPGVLDIPRNAAGKEDWSQATLDGVYIGPEIWGKGRLNWAVKRLNIFQQQ